jgi:hypothetical protein
MVLRRRAQSGSVSGRRRRSGAPRRRRRGLTAPGSKQGVRHGPKKKGDGGVVDLTEEGGKWRRWRPEADKRTRGLGGTCTVLSEGKGRQEGKTR